MSFKIRPIYKSHNQSQATSNEENNSAGQDAIDFEKIKEAAAEFNRKSSHRNLLSSSEFREALRNSSINPDLFPAFKQKIDEAIKDQEQGFRGRTNDTPLNTPLGFSTNAVKKGAIDPTLLQEELSSVLKQMNIASKNEEVDEDEEENDDDKAKREAVEKRNKERRVLRYAFPARASMLRGHNLRTTHKGGGIRPTMTGQVDAY